MNRFKKEEKKRYDAKRKGLSDDQIAVLDMEDSIKASVEELARKIHIEKFPEEWDFMYDSGADISDRSRGINPMSQEYIQKIKEKREKLGVSQLSKSGRSVSNDTYQICYEEAKNQIFSEKESKINWSDKLQQLYKEIHECKKCEKMNHEKALRKIEATNLSADVFVISQALARSTLRKSGINFHTIDGKMESTGKRLEQFLTKFNRTVDPNSTKCVYNSEIAQCYPGKAKSGKGDRKPYKTEILNCLHFLIKEIELINPKIIFLMGKSSRDGFYKYVMKKNCPKFSDHVGEVDYYKGIPTMAIQHASGANPHYSKMLQDKILIKSIKEIINE